VRHNTLEERRAYHHERRRRKLEEALTSGKAICSCCLKRPPEPGRVCCGTCAGINIRSQHRPEAKVVREKWKQRRREEAAARGVLLCSQCFSRDAKPGRKRCQGCVDANHRIAAKPEMKVKRNLRAKAPEYLAKRREYGARRASRRSDIRKAAHRTNPLRMLFKKAKERARERGVEFRMVLSDLVMPEFCPLLGTRISVGNGNKHHANSPSVDRIIPSLGYVSGNVWIISYRANAIKNDATLDELKSVVRGLANRLGVEVSP
jgi:hypothetical protein